MVPATPLPQPVRFLNSTPYNCSPSSTLPLATIMFSGQANPASKPPLKPRKSKFQVVDPGSQRSNLNDRVTSSLSTLFVPTPNLPSLVIPPQDLFVPSSNPSPSSPLVVASLPQSSPSPYSFPLLATPEILNSISPPNPNLPSQFLLPISLPSTPFCPSPNLFLRPIYS
ncbi:hypothetical protein AMTRI_Chr02g212620 [Amborella trichopoda]